jgi:hypothetical protein
LHVLEEFPKIQSILEPSLRFQSIQGLPHGTSLDDWFSTTQIHLNQINDLIRSSLFNLFGFEKFNYQKATDAYGQLFNSLAVNSTQSVAVATTNYDASVDFALENLGFKVDNGEQRTVSGYGEAPLDVTELIVGLPRRTPVLHLHGKIGWYETESGPVALPSNQQHAQKDGVPLIMLPDLNKDYGSNAVINSLWTQFETLVSNAHRILVLGHSLHDDLMVRVLRERITKPQTLAITYFWPESITESERDWARQEVERIHEFFPRAMPIPIDFDPGHVELEGVLDSWLKSINDR